MLDKRNVVITSVTIGLLSLLFTLVLFFLIVGKPLDVNYLGLGFLVLSEIALTLMTMFLFGSTKQEGRLLAKSGAVVTTGIFFLISAIFCIISSVFINNLRTLLILELIVLFIATVISIVLLVLSKHFSNKDEDTRKKLERRDYNKPKRGGF